MRVRHPHCGDCGLVCKPGQKVVPWAWYIRHVMRRKPAGNTPEFIHSRHACDELPRVVFTEQMNWLSPHYDGTKDQAIEEQVKPERKPKL